jgi:hypothetical protein
MAISSPTLREQLVRQRTMLVNALRTGTNRIVGRAQPPRKSLPHRRHRACCASQVAKLAAAGGFGIALLGLYLIFNSTGTQLSLSACAMYIVGTVAGVILMQPDK